MQWQSLKQQLLKPLDIAPLVFFRVAFGSILFIEMLRFFNKGWIERYYMQPDFFFTYDYFHWVAPWPGEWMKTHFFVMAMLALCIAFGFMYRIASSLFFLGFSYIFLLDKTNYLNHFYLIILLSFMMIWLPANRSFSVDARLWPKIKSKWQPAWALWWLRAQLGLVYFYGGVAKINGDWLRGEPMRMWLWDRQDFPIIGSLFQYEWMVYFMTYSGLLLDLLIAPALLWKRTRLWAYLLILSFHLLNSQLFTIGIFPWFMIAATLIFFPPEKFRIGKMKMAKKEKPPVYNLTPVIQYGLIVWFSIQILLPLRHHLYPGDVNWTEEGHRFAWHMKLRSKDSDLQYMIVAEGDTLTADLETFLSSRQLRKIEDKPDMIWQFAQQLKNDFTESEGVVPEIYVRSWCGLNGRDQQRLIDTTVNMAEAQWSVLGHNDWILPLEEELDVP